MGEFWTPTFGETSVPVDTDVLTRIADIPQTRLPELLPWRWKALSQKAG